jgi:hypothetical protein
VVVLIDECLAIKLTILAAVAHGLLLAAALMFA